MDKHILLRDLSGLKSFVIPMTPDNEQEQIAKLLEAMERIYEYLKPEPIVTIDNNVSDIEKNWMVHDNTEYPSADISGDYK